MYKDIYTLILQPKIFNWAEVSLTSADLSIIFGRPVRADVSTARSRGVVGPRCLSYVHVHDNNSHVTICNKYNLRNKIVIKNKLLTEFLGPSIDFR